MQSFYRNFTDGLARRFNAPSDDISPKSFDTEQVSFVSDIERRLVEYQSVNLNIESALVVSGSTTSWVMQYALRPFTNSSQWRYPLGTISRIVLKSLTASGTVDRGLGGTGNYQIFSRIKVDGNLTSDAARTIYLNSQTRAVGAGVTGDLFISFHPTDGITLYHGDTTLVYTDSGLAPGSTGIPKPQFILLQFFWTTPATAADVTINNMIVIFNLEVTYSNGATVLEQRAAIVTP